ncbi:CobD/CbiB family protein [Eleftheria terrae]|uniref:CobD/CbiB family protein n=1 Tax=Eleftheria terrae TaxID=1597781 RepID=UPI00263B61CC|nr:CobD/CbiB family protein [Eleftheria terrae]WKB54155.1 CobD/CbiB family protein [Eleftheria terrae]
MSFLSVLFALLIEQLKPLRGGNFVHQSLMGWVRWTGRNFDAGKAVHAWVVWCITVIVPSLVIWGVSAIISQVSLLLALAWNVVVLYLTLGFRQFSHYFTDIRDALERGDETTARQLLAEWRHLDASELPRSELLRHVIEHSLLAAHRHVFGVFFWFVLLHSFGLGPAGAVLYRMAEFSSRYWAYKSRTVGVPSNPRLMELAQQVFGWLDHIPARLTAFGFAVVGNFEEAVDSWRRYARLWRFANDGIILAAAAGAVGVRLGGSSAPAVMPDRSKTFDIGSAAEAADAEGSTGGMPPEAGHLRSIVGLVWRSVVLWMLLLALLSLANLIG